jgi:hypothetical protein
MLFETRDGERRLYRRGDPYHPDREGAKITPSKEEIPERYRDLLDWYEKWSDRTTRDALQSDPLLELVGSGRDLWANEHADDYVKRLREGWE